MTVWSPNLDRPIVNVKVAAAVDTSAILFWNICLKKTLVLGSTCPFENYPVILNVSFGDKTDQISTYLQVFNPWLLSYLSTVDQSVGIIPTKHSALIKFWSPFYPSPFPIRIFPTSLGDQMLYGLTSPVTMNWANKLDIKGIKQNVLKMHACDYDCCWMVK